MRTAASRVSFRTTSSRAERRKDERDRGSQSWREGRLISFRGKNNSSKATRAYSKPSRPVLSHIHLCDGMRTSIQPLSDHEAGHSIPAPSCQPTAGSHHFALMRMSISA